MITGLCILNETWVSIIYVWQKGVERPIRPSAWFHIAQLLQKLIWQPEFIFVVPWRTMEGAFYSLSTKDYRQCLLIFEYSQLIWLWYHKITNYVSPASTRRVASFVNFSTHIYLVQYCFVSDEATRRTAST